MLVRNPTEAILTLATDDLGRLLEALSLRYCLRMSEKIQQEN